MLMNPKVWMRCVGLFVLLKMHEIGCIQRFAEAPGYTEVNPGEDALLKCRVADKRGLCSWQKDNKPVGIYKGKYEWANEDSPTGGDCSLWVRSATLPLDDGQWQCQVTASNYDLQDALSSPPAALAVRVAPQSPRILYNGSHVMPGENITIPAGSRATIVCEARYGNPPASIEWYLESERLAAWSQTNASEVERPRVWAARSVLELGASRAAHARQLTCRANHPSYPSPHYRQAYTLLDVTFAPVVSIVGADSSMSKLEEGSGVVSLECKADGNPLPYVWWTKDGQILGTNGPKLILAPLARNNSGIYSCQARNSLGTSEPVRTEIDVKYPPRVLWVGPEAALEANLFSRVVLECKAEGNPPPAYRWLHNPAPGTGASQEGGYVVSSTSQLTLQNVTYKHHGQYLCVAINHIGVDERSHRSDPMTLNVLGPPLGVESGAVQAWSGREAHVIVDVCADPPPRKAVWLWGSLRLNVPSQVGRYRALDPMRTVDCYRYTLLIADTASQDARVYVLHVENERGATTHAVSLTLHETSHIVPLVAAAVVIAVLLIIIICLLRRCRRRRDTVLYKTEELDNEKSTVLPADAVYSTRDSPRHRPAEPGGDGWGSAGAGVAAGRYSPAALQAALASLEREAKDNIYAVLDPHVQYDLTIAKQGATPTHLSLSRPIIHEQHAVQTHPRGTSGYSTFRHQDTYNQRDEWDLTNPRDIGRMRRSNRSLKDKQKFKPNINDNTEHISKSNRDVKYKSEYNFGSQKHCVNDIGLNSRNFRDSQRQYRGNSSNFGDRQRRDNGNLTNVRKSETREVEDCYIRRYERQGSNRSTKQSLRDKSFSRHAGTRKRESDQGLKYDRNGNINNRKTSIHTFECTPLNVNKTLHLDGINEILRPNSGMVREIASRFDRTNAENYNHRNSTNKKERPKSLQTFDNPQYLDHVFPAAVEI